MMQTVGVSPLIPCPTPRVMNGLMAKSPASFEVGHIALDTFLAQCGHFVRGEAGINPHVLEGPIEAIYVAVEDEGLAREGAGNVENDVGDDEAPVFGREPDVAERQPLAVEVRGEIVLVNHVTPP